MFDHKNPNLRLDIQQKSILTWSMDIGQTNSSKIIIDYMYQQGMDLVRYDMMMYCLPIAESMDCCKFYIKFLSK